MYYYLNHQEKHLSGFGWGIIIFSVICHMGFVISILFNDSNLSNFFLIFFITIEIGDILFIRRDKFEGVLNLKKIILFVIGINILLYTIYIFNFLFSLIFVYFLFILIISVISEICIIYVGRYYINQGKIKHVLEINGSHIKYYRDQILKVATSTSWLNSISFFHEIIDLGDYGTTDFYTISFNILSEDDIEINYSKKKSEMTQILCFLEKYGSHYNILFKKIKKWRDTEENIENFNDYLKIEKNSLLVAILDISSGLLFSNLIMIPIIIALIARSIEWNMPELLIIALILILVFFIVAPVLFIVSFIENKKYKKKLRENSDDDVK